MCIRDSPYGDFASTQTYVRLQELGDENPLTVNRIMYTIHKKDARLIKNIGSKRFGMQLLLRGIYIHNDLFYIHVSLSNSSNVNFDIDHIRFRIADRKVAKRTALQETFVEPVRAYNAVPYTHLDVYKRQPERTCGAGAIPVVCGSIKRTGA